MTNKIIMMTAYDYPSAKIVDEVGVDYILVGDSLAMVVLGQEDTKNVTVEEMLHHTKAVSRAVKNSILIGDMPIHSYDTPENAISNGKKFLEVGAKAVKIEGNKPEIIRALINNNIKVVGHIGLLPQTAKEYKVQGKDETEAKAIYQDAIEMDKLGIIALVIECVPENLAKKITEDINTPTIGIGAGIHCSGQVLVLHDIIGLSDFQGKMVKRYANIKENIKKAVSDFKEEVLTGRFPDDQHSFK
jgi:3-methyl-2-oxobutanoate hydroxymethyltransferase